MIKSKLVRIDKVSNKRPTPYILTVIGKILEEEINMINNRKLKFLDQVRQIIQIKHYSLRTVESYVNWIKKFIFFHNKKYPKEMGEKEIGQFITHLAKNKKVSALTQNQALCAIIFLYKNIWLF